MKKKRFLRIVRLHERAEDTFEIQEQHWLLKSRWKTLTFVQYACGWPRYYTRFSTLAEAVEVAQSLDTDETRTEVVWQN